ncbi:hypothetical protein D918_06685 [Trichuris suis]|nr:hypothetical protein D918_06685 [Trichuris suis]
MLPSYILGTHPALPAVEQEFQQALFWTAIGQKMDCSRATATNSTLEWYRRLALNKTGRYSFWLPTSVALLIADVKSNEPSDRLFRLCSLLGFYYQVQDDYIDCFGSSNKEEDEDCSDIATGRANYGIRERRHVESVKAIYAKLGVKERYSQLEQELRKDISALISDLACSACSALFVPDDKDLSDHLSEELLSEGHSQRTGPKGEYRDGVSEFDLCQML